MMASPSLIRLSAATTQQTRIPANPRAAHRRAENIAAAVGQRRPSRARATWIISLCLVVIVTAVGLSMRVATEAASANQAPRGLAGRQALSYAQPGGSGFDAQAAVQLPPAVTQPAATPIPQKPMPPPAPPGANTIGQPCHSTHLWAPSLSLWTAPPDCYGLIYPIDASKYPPASSTFGYCNWWVNELHRDKPDLLYGTEYRRGSAPVPGAAVYFAGLAQGAGASGHFAQVVAIAPDHYWMLITEMNFAWRGGGFGKVDYRYAHVGSGVTFIYP
jgi:hypothetical protein